MCLNTPLGGWLPVSRTTWHSAYCTKTHLYWRRKNNNILHILLPSKTSGFYHFAGTTTILPLDSHLIPFQQVGEALWMQQPYLPGLTALVDPLPPGHMVENTLSHPDTEVLTLGSDGSVHLSHQVVACAWMIHASTDSCASACFLLSHISSLSSYHSKLEGIFRSLKHVEYLGLTPAKIHHYCDNEAAVNKSNHAPRRPSAMMQPEADILLAIHYLRQTLSCKGTSMICRHIYAHQDTRAPHTLAMFSPDQPRHTLAQDILTDELPLAPLNPLNRTPSPTACTCHPLDTPTRIKIECDRIASHISQAAINGGTGEGLPPTLPYPLLRLRALLQIGETWITSHERCHIHWAVTIQTKCWLMCSFAHTLLELYC